MEQECKSKSSFYFHEIYIKYFGKTQERNILKSAVELDVGSFSFSSVTQSCPTFCDPKDCSMPGLPVHHRLLEFTQTYVH